MKIFIGAEHIISPLGATAEENFTNALNNSTGLSEINQANFKADKNLFLGAFDSDFEKSNLLNTCFSELKINKTVLKSNRTKIILSSTKGYIDSKIEFALLDVLKRFQSEHELSNSPLIISTACTSGVLGVIKAGEMIRANLYDTVIVLGIDFLSKFVTCGFESLYALEDGICKPFDKKRKGINLGEAVSGIVLSNLKTVFNETPLEYVSGSSSNDANHISGPSRTGEGLFRSITKTVKRSGLKIDDIDYISAHGTGTLYNDNMESIALKRLGLHTVPVNSLKAYFGHTLGAAGLVEISMLIQQLRHQTVLKSGGYERVGTDEELNMIKRSGKGNYKVGLKTASGFGGGNASVLIKI